MNWGHGDPTRLAGRCCHLQPRALNPLRLGISFNISGWLKPLRHELITCRLRRQASRLWSLFVPGCRCNSQGMEPAGPECEHQLSQWQLYPHTMLHYSRVCLDVCRDAEEKGKWGAGLCSTQGLKGDSRPWLLIRSYYVENEAPF